MKTSKTLLTLAIAASLLAITYLTSCLKDGSDTIIVEGNAKVQPDPSHDPEPDPNSEPEPESEEPVDQSDLQGESGELRFNIQWEGESDLDLSVENPCGEVISFYNRKTYCNGSVGQLDIDANYDIFPEHPQENIYWDKNNPGTYYVYVANCSYHVQEELR